jgi:uncharacterized membrane protein
MNKIILIIAIIVIVAIVIFFILPYFSVQYFWSGPLEKKRQDIANFQKLCGEWNTTGCSGNPSDELCKAAVGKIATTFFPLDTKKCGDVSDDAIAVLRTACCG